jgi:hypothetical protein
MKRTSRIVLTGLAVCLLTAMFGFRVTAQNAPAGSPAEIVGNVMDMIGQGRLDDAVNLMDGLNSHDDLKQDVRGQLLHLRDEQGHYHGYDIAATQKFTANFQRIDVIANYDQQPVLIRISFYRPMGSEGKWTVLYFHIHTNVVEILDILKDSPVDYAEAGGRFRLNGNGR